MAQLTDREDSWYCQGHPDTCMCDYHNRSNVEIGQPKLDHELYKGFRIYREKFFINENDIDVSKEYFLRGNSIVEANKDCNLKSYRLNEYHGNGTIKQAIDVYITHKDMAIPKQPHTLIFDYWFDELKLDTKLFLNTFKADRIGQRFIDFKDHFDYLDHFRNRDERMKVFLTDDKINEFWDIIKLTRIIEQSKAKNFDYLV